MKPTRPAIHAIWVRFSPYLVSWAEEEFGTAIELSNKKMLELRPVPGVRKALKEIVDEDLTLTINSDNSMSQLRYDIIKAALVVEPEIVFKHYDITADVLNTFLPVHVPEYLLTENGALRPFSRIMQLRHTTASFVAMQVYHAFWREVGKYAKEVSFDTDRDMLESFCEEHLVSDTFLDDLRNQYQRLKRNNYYVNKS